MSPLLPRPLAARSGVAVSSYRTDLVETPAPFARLELDPLDRTLGCEVAPAGGPATRAARFPRVGESFLGFELVSELGSGAFGKVFLARQLGLAGRPVALKVTTRPTAEPQQLAKLHHTNIVPIHSVHDAAPLQAVCMPYLGARTLADVVVPYLTTGVFAATHALTDSTKALGRTAPTPAAVAPPEATPAPRPLVRVLDGLSAAEQVGWVLRTVRGVAEGLAHAHDRGILHLDMKPANVLIADDGAPLLLDFNLAKDAAAGPREQTGGTLPYMAPEQLDGFRDRDDRLLDARTDLFGLGVIFYELLTGKHPFPRPANAMLDLARMARDRRAGAGQVREHNPAVPRAVESIVATLLQPLPERRYPSAAALVADLSRQLDSRPLAFAPEPSAAERLAKWRRRNPRLGARLLTATLALAAAGATGALAYSADARADHAAADGQRRARAELAELRIDLLDRADPAARAAAAKGASDLLGRYGLELGRPWVPTAAYRRLPAAQRLELANDCGELCRLLAAAAMAPARDLPAEKAAELAAATLPWLSLAESCYADSGTPRGLHRERAALLAAAGQSAPADPADPAEGDPVSESFLTGVGHFLAGRYAKAVPPLEEATLGRPAHAAAQFLLAASHYEMADYGPAAERFLVAKSLAPASGRPSLNRGVIALVRARNGDAECEFTDALTRDPRLAAAHRHRATARERQGKFAEADADLTHFLSLDANSTEGYLARAAVRAKLGDDAGAAADRLRSRQCQPTTAEGFVTRGGYRVEADPAGAERDFRRATELDPRSRMAWQNLARLAGLRGDFDAALAIQERAVVAAPESADVRLGRAVLLAGLGQRDSAHADVRAALELGGGSAVHFEVARAYALTARRHPADADLALEQLKAAFLAGLDAEIVEGDPAFDGLREGDEFRRCVATAKAFAALSHKQPVDD